MASAILLLVIGRGKEWKLESGILPDFEMKNRKEEWKETKKTKI
jgi:hypothetical protein